jgi:O-antigen ligase
MLGGYAAFGYLYCFQERSDRRWHRWWLPLVALTGLIWGVFGIVRVLTGGTAREAATVASTYSYGAFRPFFSEHGTYSAYLGMLLPAALLGALERRGAWRYLYGFSTACIGAGIVLAFARAGWLAILVVVPATVFAWAGWRQARRRLLLPAAMALAVALFVAGVGVSRQIARHVQSVASAENVSNLERLSRWTAATAMARDRPLTGVGFGCYVDAYPAYKRRAILTEQGLVRMGTHSEPLKLLSELGVPGFLAAVWLLAAVLQLGVRAFRRLPEAEDRVLALAAMAGLATYVVNGIFNAYLVETKVTVPFWAAIGVIAALGRRLKKPAGAR